MKICPSCNRIFGSGIAVCPRDGRLLNDLREWRAGDSVGEKFRIVEKIGHGSLGPSFRAKLLPYGGVRVLKCLSVRLSDDPDLLDRFRREIRTASALKHINAVHVESLEHAPDGHPFIVMEYAPGLSLRELLSRGGFIPALDVVDIMVQVCAALDCAHWQGIIHRNLKPDNVIVVEEHDGAPRVKVMEFGMANIRQAAAECGRQVGDVVMTDHGAIVGTMEYMSPEQAAGAASDRLDGRSDIYAVGVMMFEALTGELPLSADDPKGLLFRHQGNAANEQLCGTILKALQKDPERRFPTAAAMITALRAVATSLGKPSPVSVMSVAAGSPHAVPTVTEASSHPSYPEGSGVARAAEGQKARSAVPGITGVAPTAPRRTSPRMAAPATDQPFEEMRKAWQRSVGQLPAGRRARRKVIRTGLLFVCCLLGVFLAARVIYFNRMLFMLPPMATPPAGRIEASPDTSANDVRRGPESEEDQPPPINGSAGGQLSTIEESGLDAPLPGVSSDAHARPSRDGAAVPSREPKTPTSTGRMPSEVREAEMKKRIAAGWLLIERGDPEAAVKSFTEALTLDPSNVEAQAALRLARFAVRNPTVDVLTSGTSGDGNDGKKGQP